MEDALEGRTALVTGASRGIGRAIAVALAERGVHVALVARSRDGLMETAQACEDHGVRALVLSADLTDMAATAQVVSNTVETLGGLAFLVNNAGIYEPGRADTASMQAWDRVIDVNLRSLIHLTRHALPEIAKGPRGAIVNIASISARMSHGGAGIYCATKHGVLGFAGSVFEDVRERGVKVSTICPGFVNTDMVSSRGLVLEKTIQPRDIARTVLFVLSFPDTGCPTEIVVRPQRSPYR